MNVVYNNWTIKK